VAGIAHQAEAVIAGIERYPDLTAALADCGLVVATTGRARRVRYSRQAPRAAAPGLLAAAQPGAPAAVLFGREDTGLPNEALSSAHLLVTIPTDPAHHSLNLAQAALVIAYELWLAAQAAPRDRPAAPVPALGAAREEMFAALDALLEGPGGRPAAHRAHDLEILRAVLLRAAPRADEAARLTDLFRRVARAHGAPPPSGV
jgi:TrmH family RNA methyltransferase